MAANMFVKISDIPGDATEEVHDKWIVISSCGWNVARAVDMTDLGSTQRGHANSNFGKVTVASELGVASAKLMLSVANGTVRPLIEIHQCRSGESASAGLEPYLIWKLKDVVIDSYDVSGGADSIPSETWSLAYTSIEVEYKSTDQASGKLTKENDFKWDLQKGKVA